jgi:DNA-binding transcriptional MocR family regulator
MSKIFLPGLRIGWLKGPPPIVEAVTHARQAADIHPNSIMQHVMRTFLNRGWLAEHVQMLRPTYASRRDTMLAALERMAPPGMTWTYPAGGYFIWCRLPAGMRARALAVEAAREGVTFVSGEAFSPTGNERDALRLNYSGVPDAQIEEGVRRLTVAIRRLARQDAPTRNLAPTATRPVV